MSIINSQPRIGAAGQSTGFKIERSLRFNSADDAHLDRTPASAGNRKTWTWSGWVKRSSFGFQALETVDDGPGEDSIAFLAGDTIRVYMSPVAGNGTVTDAVFRDSGAWYHIVVAVDTTQATAANRTIIYVNNVNVTSSSSNYITQDSPTKFNGTFVHYIGRYANQVQPYGNFDGYMTEINFIDGSALTPSSFGETDSATGVWKPKAYSGSYGTNGFYLKFADNSGTTSTTLGKDSSGNGNNWTPNNFYVGPGTTNAEKAGIDSLVDSPTAYGTDTGAGGEVRGNYATWNRLFVIPSNTTNTFANGNLEFTVTDAEGTGTATAASTMALPTTGKWYWEITPTTVATGNAVRTEIGIMNPTQAKYLFANDVAATDCYAYAASGVKVSGQSQVAYGNSYTDNDVIGVAVDLDNGAIYFAKNGTWQNSGVPTSGASKTGAAYTTLTGSSNYLAAVGYWGTYVANFGQRPFAYTAPSGFKALCTQNLPTPTIGATSTTQAGKYFNTVLYTGTGSSLGVTGVGFQPDWTWIKSRSAATDHGLYDAVRGVQKQLESNNTGAETTETTGLTAFNTDGFTVGALAQLNTSSATYASWNWKANGAGSSNNAGSIQSTVSANTTAGFSIVTYTGTGANATVGHGCLVNNVATAPSFIICKERNTAGYDWRCYHASLGATKYIDLNATAAAATASTIWQDTAPTSTLFSIGTNGSVNVNTGSFIAYCFAPVAGYSAFGSYTGNASTDGPMIYTGFRPAYVLIKRSGDGANNWEVRDRARDPYNTADDRLFPNTSGAEDANNEGTDFLSNGFKIRNSGSGCNANGATYIYAAFAEHPFKYALAR